MTETRKSPHFRNYGMGITIIPSKTDYSKMPPDKEARRLIAIVNEYVDNDDGAKGGELCTVIHNGKVCCKIEGHK